MANNKGLSSASIFAGLIVTSIVAVSSVYIAFMLSALPWPIIISVIMSYAILKAVSMITKKENNIHEANVAQAAGSVGGLVGAAIVFTIPAIIFITGSVDYVPSPLTIWLIAVLGGLLGVTLSIHVKKITVDEEDLPFPSGTAGAEVLIAMEEKEGKAGLLFIALLISFAISSVLLFFMGFPIISDTIVLGGIVFVMSIYLSMAAVGVGYIINFRSAVSWFFGALIGWVCLSAIFQIIGYDPASALIFVQRLGIGIVFGFGLAFMLSRLAKSFSGRKFLVIEKKEDKLVFVLSLISIIALVLVGLNPLAAILAVLGAWVMSFIAGKTTGETDIDPLEQFGLFVGLAIMAIFAIIGLRMDIIQVILIITFVSAAASLAGDIGHDFKSAEIIGTRDTDIFWIDFIAVIVGGAIATVASLIIMHSYLNIIVNVPSVAFQSKLVAAVLESSEQPVTFYLGLIIGFVIGILPLFWEKSKVFSSFVLPFGIGLFLGPTLAIPIIIGGIVALIYQNREKGIIIASGLLAGEGLSGFIIGILKVLLL